MKPVVTETPQRSVWRVFGDITKFIGIISVYLMLKFDLQLTPYKLSIMEHLKEAGIANCASLAKWMTSHIDVVRTTLVFRLSCGSILIKGCTILSQEWQVNGKVQLGWKCAKFPERCAGMRLTKVYKQKLDVIIR